MKVSSVKTSSSSSNEQQQQQQQQNGNKKKVNDSFFVNIIYLDLVCKIGCL